MTTSGTKRPAGTQTIGVTVDSGAAEVAAPPHRRWRSSARGLDDCMAPPGGVPTSLDLARGVTRIWGAAAPVDDCVSWRVS